MSRDAPAGAKPVGDGRWWHFWEQRGRHLQHQARVKEERIVELEAENAILHLKLAEYRERTGRSRGDCVHLPPLNSSCSALAQLHQDTRKLKQDIQEFLSSSLFLLKSCQDQCRVCLSEIVTAVQANNEALQACQSKVACLEQSLQEVSARYQLEKQQRRFLHNSLVELKGNLRVHCRIRPLLPFDSEFDDPVLQTSSASREVAHAVDDETVLVKCNRPGRPLINKTYTFERVYGPAASQSVVFGDVCPLLTSLLDGYNVCIMAYGQTGSGKSYTMLGPHPADGSALPLDAHGDIGIIPRAAAELFRLISEDASRSTKVEVSIVEVYNNDIFDLLAKDNSTVASVVKRELKTTKEGRRAVSLLTCEAVCSAAEFMKLVHGGLQLRVKHPTLVHEDSSRSHLIITVTLTTAPSSDSTEQACRQTLPQEPACPWPLPTGAGKRRSNSPRASPPRPADPAGRAEQVQVQLQLVDLAGSECTGLSGVTGLALRETSFINRSLAALADVLGALSERRSHVPYRNSKLTRLLQDSLGGDAKLLVILCVSPSQKHVAETLQGLGFGTRARQAERGQARKRSSSSQRKERVWMGSSK